MSPKSRHVTSASPGDTAAVAVALGARLRAGDVVLLSGDIGAGKTHFARALIQSLLDVPEDVPSPTFTLVQTYDTRAGEVWHTDLYRLGSVDQIEELGLAQAFESAIVLVEWPDRLGAEAPRDALQLEIRTGASDDARALRFHWLGRDWATRLDAALAQVFLARAGWAEARQEPLAGDASARRYTRLYRDSDRAVLMCDPGGDVARFARLARHLSGLGLSAPDILAEAPGEGFLLLEDLGDALFAREAVARPDLEATLYRRAADVLLTLHASAPPPGLPTADPETLAQATDLAFDWYAEATPGEASRAAMDAVQDALERHAALTDVMILRDYHAENLLWLPARKGVAQAGLLDFQDAMLGHRAYDLVSLVHDARRDVPDDVVRATIEHYLAGSGMDRQALDAAMAVLGAQRNLRILGIFARLARRDGKPQYLALLPRVWRHLQVALQHPALADVKAHLDPLLPAPTPERIAELEAVCPAPR